MSENTEKNLPVAVGVSFRTGGKVYHFAPNGVRVTPGDYVLAKTERGVDIGEVVYLKDELSAEDNERQLKPLVRRATRDDVLREERLREREKEATKICEAQIAEHKLPMKLIDADYAFDAQRITFFFSAEGRVDFRALVRDLAEALHCRIELRQIGVRDEAKMIGGLGPCGRPLCCAQWLRSFDPVGIKVAKDQGMPLNPAKISGICDRLMCCLRYEHEVYKELAARLPQVGDEVRGQGRVGRVRSVALLQEMVTVDFQDAESRQTVEVPAQDLRRSRGYWLQISAGKATPFSPPGAPAEEPEPTPAREPAPVSSEEPRVIMREPRRGRPTTGSQPAPAPVEAPAPAGEEKAAEEAKPHKSHRSHRRRGKPRGEQQQAAEAQSQPSESKPEQKAEAKPEGTPAAKAGGSSRRRSRRPGHRSTHRPEGKGEAKSEAKAAPAPEKPSEGPAPAPSGEKQSSPAGEKQGSGSGRRQWRRRRPRHGGSATSAGDGKGSGGSNPPEGGSKSS